MGRGKCKSRRRRLCAITDGKLWTINEFAKALGRPAHYVRWLVEHDHLRTYTVGNILVVPENPETAKARLQENGVWRQRRKFMKHPKGTTPSERTATWRKRNRKYHLEYQRRYYDEVRKPKRERERAERERANA